jgi:hypothetical protein
MEIKKQTVYRMDYTGLPDEAQEYLVSAGRMRNDTTLEWSFDYTDAPWELNLLNEIQAQHPEFEESDCLLIDICW